MASFPDKMTGLYCGRGILLPGLWQLFVITAGLLLLFSAAFAGIGTPAGPSYAVQAGLYVGPVQSNRMAEELISSGYAAWVEERPQAQGKMLYFVLVGPFAEEVQAHQAVRSIAGKFKIDPFIVELNHH